MFGELTSGVRYLIEGAWGARTADRHDAFATALYQEEAWRRQSDLAAWAERAARRLARLVEGIPAKVNLIPFNTFPGTRYRRSLFMATSTDKWNIEFCDL
mgnify:CR=1 FL=1